MNRKNYFWGVILILVGAGALINNIFDVSIFSMSHLWPLILIFIGLSFEVDYFSSRRSAGVLVPAGILTTIGILFLFENFTKWHFSQYTWPIYPFSVAVGLFQLYLFGERKSALLIPVFILTAISVSAFATMLFGDLFQWVRAGFIMPIILICVGVWIILKNFRA